MITTFGLTSEGLEENPMYVYIYIDTYSLSNTSFGVVLGDAYGYNSY